MNNQQYYKVFVFFLTIHCAWSDTITVVGRVYCNDTYIVGDAYIELNDFDGLLAPDFMGDTVVHLNNKPYQKSTFRVSGSATDGAVDPRVEPYLRIYHGCGVSMRTECLQLLPEQNPTEEYFYYIGDIVLNNDKAGRVWESCNPTYCKKLTNWQVCYEVQGKTELIKRVP